jgi:PhzF family phenazine biosynthesis protein
MQLTIYQVDSFTSEPFKGNPAGVCLIEKPLDKKLMQNLAMEMNIAETAFIYPINDKKYSIRFFTPTVEIDLCGHATLATANIMYETGIIPKDKEIIFDSRSGELRVTYDNGWIKLNFPAYDSDKVNLSKAFSENTGVIPIDIYESTNDWTLVHLEKEEDVLNLKPNIGALTEVDLGHMIVTAKSNQPNIDYVVRCFVPKSGIDEDPVTGSAQCVLVPFWHKQTGKTEFNAIQASKRSGFLKLKYFVNEKRVEISGQVKTVFKVDVLI